jgi:hypothetical protein
VLQLGREELLIRRRCEVVGIANDFLIALWFVASSLLFFHESTSPRVHESTVSGGHLAVPAGQLRAGHPAVDQDFQACAPVLRPASGDRPGFLIRRFPGPNAA